MTKPYTEDMLSAVEQDRPATTDWLASLQELAMRLESLGVGCDLASLTIIELWAVYRFLVRVAGE